MENFTEWQAYIKRCNKKSHLDKVITKEVVQKFSNNQLENFITVETMKHNALTRIRKRKAFEKLELLKKG